MTTDSDPQRDVSDETLLRELGSVLGARKPLPAEAVRAAKASFTWRTVEAELAQLTYDSADDRGGLAMIRGPAPARLLTFEADGLTIEAEVATVDGHRRLVCQLVPPQVAEVEVQHAETTVRTTADELGRFVVDGVPAGPVRLRCILASAPQRPVVTEWMPI
ncbi:MAG TPA: hypothetical protein VNK73_17895 [Actinomycetota bacterium]|nr:hypothetical protein [Actinomycetota bacterium]